jgi:hypothetical protein
VRDGRLAQLEMGAGRSGRGGHCGCQRRAGAPGVGARSRCAACRPAVPDRRCGILEAGPREAAEPGSAPTGEGDRSAQQHQRKLSRSRHSLAPPVSAPPQGTRHSRPTASIVHSQSLRAKTRRLRVIRFSEACCPNTTRVSTVKAMQNDARLEAIIAEMERLALTREDRA